jgi:hypothetical protein
MSLKNINIAETIMPTPRLKMVSQIIGYINKRYFQVKGNLLKGMNTRKMAKLSKKFTTDTTIFDSKKMYFGTLIDENILALFINVCMPVEVDSLKKL